MHPLPNLSLLVRKYLGIVATSVPSERLFSVAGLVVNNKRASLEPTDLEKLFFYITTCIPNLILTTIEVNLHVMTV